MYHCKKSSIGEARTNALSMLKLNIDFGSLMVRAGWVMVRSFACAYSSFFKAGDLVASPLLSSWLPSVSFPAWS